MVDQETDGTITVLFLRFFPSSKVWAINKFAEEPEFTKIEYFLPIIFENLLSKVLVTFD